MSYIRNAKGSIEVFWLDGTPKETGWYWWKCEPGLIPHGPEHGPFMSKDGALADSMFSHDS